MDEQPEEGYSNLFYVMLVLGIIGVIGLFMVSIGAAAGADEEPPPPISGIVCIPVPPATDLSGCNKVYLPVIAGGE